MQLKNEFVVAAGVDETWDLLTDLDRIAPCMPGAGLDGRDGEDYLGSVKIKVGPISAHFRGAARFVEQDDANHSATISASGKDPKGQATASATIRAWLKSESATSTRVFVDTDLDITGRMAQFGRGAIADVSNRLIGQFTDNLSREITAGQRAVGGAPQGTAASGTHAAAAAPVSNDLNALPLLGPTVAKAAVGPLLGLLIGILLGRRMSKGSK